MNINSVNHETYVQAALANHQEAQKLLSPKTILEMIKDFFTCGGVTKARMENLVEFKALLYSTLPLKMSKDDIPAELSIQFLGRNVKFYYPESHDEKDVCIQIIGESGALNGFVTIPKEDYVSFLRKIKVEEYNPAPKIATNVDERVNSTAINELLSSSLQRSKSLSQRGVSMDSSNLSYSSFSVEYPQVILHSVRPMVNYNLLASVCNELKVKSESSHKTEIMPLGIINRPGLYENHAVVLICHPGQTPLIIDSKSGPGYPKGIDVINTGNQSFFDRKSCWAHAVQQAIHYTYFLANDVKFEHITPHQH